MYLHETGDPVAVVENTVQVKTPVTLQITIDPRYSQDYDLLPLDCYVNGYPIVFPSCASYPMSNFTKSATGSFHSDFKMFRTIVNGVPDPTLSFECTMYVCNQGECPSTPCVINS